MQSRYVKVLTIRTSIDTVAKKGFVGEVLWILCATRRVVYIRVQMVGVLHGMLGMTTPDLLLLYFPMSTPVETPYAT